MLAFMKIERQQEKFCGACIFSGEVLPLCNMVYKISVKQIKEKKVRSKKSNAMLVP